MLQPSAQVWLASFIPVTVPLRSWFPWLLATASMIAVTVVETYNVCGLRSALFEGVCPGFRSE
jgi:predicted lysophospholipase L1 biosynthesis ABC-type transport system permease subunit